MSTYRNGDIPDHLLERRGNFLLTAGTWAKWDALVADVFARFGVTLRITDGVGVMKGTGAFRTRLMQRAVKRYYTALGRPWQAATEGTSSHGGEFKGEDALAVDVNNYWAIPYDEFKAACRRAGFEPDYFDGRDGKPLERWHIIDRQPYRRVAAPSAEESTPVILPVEEENEEDTMKVFGYIRPGKDKRTYYVTMDFAGGLWDEFVTNDTDYAVSVANKWGNGAPLLSLGHRDQLAEKFNQRWPELASMTKR